MKFLLVVILLPVVLTYALPQHGEDFTFKSTEELKTRWASLRESNSLLALLRRQLRPRDADSEDHEGPTEEETVKEEDDDWYFSEEESEERNEDEAERKAAGRRRRRHRPSCPGDHEFWCASGETVCHAMVCDGVMNCRSGDDEAGCGCRAGEFLCDSFKCLPFSARCDGVPDCADNADEISCGGVGLCPSDHAFRCASGEEVCQVKVCDGVMDCISGDDEAGCGCNKGQFLCDHSRCMPYSYRCDGIADCWDGADEANCGWR